MAEWRYWYESHAGDRRGYELYRRHYSSRKNPRPKQRQFVGPGQRIVLMGWFCSALFVWRRELYRLDSQTGINCAVFRNESDNRSSDMIRDAMVFAWRKWPGERLFTFINPTAIRSTNPGCCFKMAGWRKCGATKGGLLVFEVKPSSTER